MSKFTTKTTIIPKIQENKSSNIIKCYLNNLNNNNKFEINKNELRCHKGSGKDIIQEIFKRFSLPFYIPLICLVACLLIMNERFNVFHKFYKIGIFSIGFSLIFISEILIKFSGLNKIHDLIIFILPIIVFISIYLLTLKKNVELTIKINLMKFVIIYLI